MSRIHVTTLGRLHIERAGDEIADLPAQPVRCALFLYLALERSASRDALTALLWPESAPERARRSLNQTLYELRHQLGHDWITSHRDRLEVANAVTVDALDFASAVAAGRDEEALAAYRGSFLEGYHLGGTVPFQSWVGATRAHLARIHRDLCRRFTEERSRAGDLDDALAAARRWAEAEPLEDEAHHQIVALLAGLGRRSEALEHYEEYRALIARELEVEPLEDLKQLVARIREGSTAVAGAQVTEETHTGEPERAVAAEREARLPRRPSAAGRSRGWIPAAATALAAVVVLIWVAADGGLPETGEVPTALDSGGIAVLPFVNMSADPEKEYFSDGITEDLLTSLSRVPHLRVISRTSVMRYKQTDLPLREIARELGVRYILEGSVRREDDRVRITAQLIDAAADRHLWAETYDREMTSIFRIQSEIAERIAGQLRHRLDPGERARIATGGTDQVAAYDLLLRGREYLNRPGQADVRKYPPAMNFFRESLEMDPQYARAYVGLSEAFRNHVALPLALRTDSALVYAERAVELDPGSAEAAAALGWAYMIAREWREAGDAFRRALERDPDQVDALSGHARLAWVDGRFDQAVHWQLRASRVDPFAAQTLATLGSFLMNLGDLEGAERAYRRSAELSPDAPASAFMLAQIHLIRGDTALAERRMAEVEATAPGHPGSDFLVGRFHAQLGRYERAAAHLVRAAEALGGGAAATVSLQRAYVAGGLGQEELATEMLARAEADLIERERAGAYVPRLRLQLHALRGETAAAIEILRGAWEEDLAGDLLAGPQLGLYWLDRDPLLRNLTGDSTFQSELRRIRRKLESQRKRLD